MLANKEIGNVLVLANSCPPPPLGAPVGTGDITRDASLIPEICRPSLKHVSVYPCTDCADDDGGPGWDSDNRSSSVVGVPIGDDCWRGSNGLPTTLLLRKVRPT
jgi:hypothetical protein